MKLGRFRQFALERKRYVIDYSQWLQPGETISTAVVTPPAALTINSSSIAGATVIFFASGGVGGGHYPCTVTITTSLGQTKVDMVSVEVVA